MNYIDGAIKIIIENISSYILYLTLYILPIGIMRFGPLTELETIPSMLLELIFSAVSLFFIVGVYYHFISEKRVKKKYFTQLLKASKKYYLRILFVTFCRYIVPIIFAYMIICTIRLFENSFFRFQSYSNLSSNINSVRLAKVQH